MSTSKWDQKIEQACEIAELLKNEVKQALKILDEDDEEDNGTSEQREVSKSRSKGTDSVRSNERNSGRSKE